MPEPIILIFTLALGIATGGAFTMAAVIYFIPNKTTIPDDVAMGDEAAHPESFLNQSGGPRGE